MAGVDFHDGVNKGVAPVTYGAGDRPPRGDYRKARADYTCEQDYAQYSAADHETYKRLYTRQLQQLPGLACEEFIHAVQQLGEPAQIPRFDAVSERLMKATGWQIVSVPGLIPEEAFFALLAARKFPVTDWIRKPEEFDYVVEPDVFHDLFGHVPLLFNPVFADYMQAYGAGILSSAGELRHSVTAPQAERVAFDLKRLMRSRYKIDTFQATYFVIDDFDQLFKATAPDFTPIYRDVRQRIGTHGEIEAGQVLPGERRFSANPTPLMSG